MSLGKKAHLGTLGYKDTTESSAEQKWQAKVLTEIVQKPWGDQSHSVKVKAAAEALDLANEKWAEWQEEWRPRAITPATKGDPFRYLCLARERAYLLSWLP